MPTKPTGKAPAKNSVAAQKKTPRKTAAKKRVAQKRTAPIDQTPAASAALNRPETTTVLYPSPQYTRWTLVTIGEFYLLTILCALAVLGILYWLTAMSDMWWMAAFLSQ